MRKNELAFVVPHLWIISRVFQNFNLTLSRDVCSKKIWITKSYSLSQFWVDENFHTLFCYTITQMKILQLYLLSQNYKLLLEEKLISTPEIFLIWKNMKFPDNLMSRKSMQDIQNKQIAFIPSDVNNMHRWEQ